MEYLSSAIAAIPPASYITKHLYLRSRLPRRVGDVTLCTQCSIDRLERLEAQAKCWSGVISAAVMVPCPCTPASIRLAVKRVKALHAKVEESAGPCRLDIALVRHQRKLTSLPHCSDPSQYPINALRNVALRFAATELVLLLDVDLLTGYLQHSTSRRSNGWRHDVYHPLEGTDLVMQNYSTGFGIQEELWNHDVYAGYHRACTELRRVIVLPALQQVSPSRESAPIRNEIQAGISIASTGKANLVKMWEEGTLRDFASHVYPLGHGPTNTERWLSSAAMYQVQYKDGYEPYFLCARRLVPWYDERFVGYGRNKVIHAFHTASLDFRFWVHPDWFVVHVDHPLSPAWVATLGPDPEASQRLHDVKSMYDTVKSELVSRPTHSGVCLSPGVCAWDVPVPVPQLANVRRLSLPQYLWSKRTDKVVGGEEMGHWSCADKPPESLFRSSSSEYLETLHDLRYHYMTSNLRPARGSWPLRSKLPRKSRDITLVTVATWDRLQRLAAQCRVWNGVIAAAIFAPQNVNVEALKADLLNLHDEVEKAGRCRLDVILLEPATTERRLCCCQQPGGVSSCNGRATKSKQCWSTELCPINALRNVALGLAVTDLILLLDVDLLPAASLNECSEDEEQYNCLWRIAVEERTAIVVPSFQFSWKKFTALTDLPLIHSSDVDISDDEIMSSLRSVGRESFSESGEDGLQKHGRSLASLRQQAAVVSRAERIADQGADALRNGLAEGWVCGFHIQHYPRGHGPTDFDLWSQLFQKEEAQSDDICCAVCRSYDITYEEGFEPFVICSREVIPRFDERFRGYGYDKVSFFYHLHLLKFNFRVLLHAYALNIPHAKSLDWMRTFGPCADKLQPIRVKALYQRFKRELQFKTSASISLTDAGELSAWDLRETGSSLMEFRSTADDGMYQSLVVSSTGRYNRPEVEGLTLGWQGTVAPRLSGNHVRTISQLSSGIHSPIIDLLDKDSSSSSFSHEEETEIKKCNESRGSEQQHVLEQAKVSLCKDASVMYVSGGMAETRLEKPFGFLRPLRNIWFCADLKAHRADEESGNRCSSKVTFSGSAVSISDPGESSGLEEFRWDTSDWKLRASAQSLANCSVVRFSKKNCNVDGDALEDEPYRLRVSMSAGSWSPQASRLAGITTGGIAVRSLLPVRATREVMLRYMVRFPSSFQWVKGGTLPGLWVHDLLQTTFAWRRAGKGQFSPVLTGQGLPEKTPPKNLPNMSKPFFFVAGRWHAVQIVVSVSDHGLESDLEEDYESDVYATNSNLDEEGSTKRVPFPYTLDFESVRRGAVLEIEASVDFEVVSKLTYAPYARRLPIESSVCRERGAPMGLVFSCYFGGKTRDWATPVDTHIDFREVKCLRQARYISHSPLCMVIWSLVVKSEML
ncbi:hypothetical protein R1sor_007692 [Riccia sorocarpa]|uniref:Polysaccharide lyase 14 domain-containing protein n=1 Tax=Riccia sorocarpa TaxID=122646 RepID=A0ABD3HTD7_9MARC